LEDRASASARHQWKIVDDPVDAELLMTDDRRRMAASMAGRHS